MGFMSPNYNPAGIRKATPYEDQILILDAESEAQFTTEVLATSYFRNDADYKTNLALVDSWSAWDDTRLAQVLGSQYIELTSDDKTALGNIAGVLISRGFFKVYTYSLDNATDGAIDGTRSTMFYNPETLKRNHWLHVWAVISMSPFANGVVFVKDAPGITSVTINPATLVATPGQYVQLNAIVVATNFANKSVQWSVDTATGQRNGHLVEVDQTGKVKIPADYDTSKTIKIKATSIYDKTKSATATISFA